MAFSIDVPSSTPPFEQLRVQISRAAAEGELAPGSSLPTVRALAAELGLAVNTVAKAYRALETDGVIETHGRAGSIIARRRGIDPAAAQAAAGYVRVARRLGLSREEAALLVDQAWS